MKIICATHSSRPFFEASCSVNQLEQRFSRRNWDQLPPLDSFPPVQGAISFKGALTLWRLDEENGYRLTFLSSYLPDYKIQFAAFTKNTLLVLGSDRLEILDTELKRTHTFSDPWLVGGHTVYVDDRGYALVTSAPANAILVIDLDRLEIVERVVMPEMYGRGYPLEPADDLHQHFISTDNQPTHVNCAYPVDDGFLVTSFIHGSVGFFDRDRNYREIVRGYRGCHGGKRDRVSGDLYLTDSASGNILFFDYETGAVKRRFHLDSKWLHDSDQIDGTVFATGVSDSNKLEIIDLATETVFSIIDCDLFGKSVMFVNSCEVSPEWEAALDSKSIRSQVAIQGTELDTAKEYIPPLPKNTFWFPNSFANTQVDAVLKTDTELDYEFLVESDVIYLPPGDYRFRAEVYCRKGGLSIGLLDKFSNQWLSQLLFDPVNSCRSEEITIDNSTYTFAVIAANNPTIASNIEAEVPLISLKRKSNVPTQANGEKDEIDLSRPERHWPEMIPSFDDESAWTLETEWAIQFGSLVFGKNPLQFEHLIKSTELTLSPGNYVFDGELFCLQGGIQFGLLDFEANDWILTYSFDSKHPQRREYPVIREEKKVQVAVFASNDSGPELTSVELKHLSLRKIVD